MGKLTRLGEKWLGTQWPDRENGARDRSLNSKASAERLTKRLENISLWLHDL